MRHHFIRAAGFGVLALGAAGAAAALALNGQGNVLTPLLSMVAACTAIPSTILAGWHYAMGEGARLSARDAFDFNGENANVPPYMPPGYGPDNRKPIPLAALYKAGRVC